jgi:hypothetical protein
VVDNNEGKSIAVQAEYVRPTLTASVLYFGGPERARGDAAGPAWRHLFDAHVTWHADPRISFIGHANAGFEENRYGISYWGAGALSARVKVLSCLFVAARADFFEEHAAMSAGGRASPLFWPARWVSSRTATLDYRPHERVSFRLEYRNDRAAAETYFGGEVINDTGGRAIPNRRFQDTLTLGVTSWL